MLLRRVIAHFRKQEWTAIAIDFVIVVAGVFIGIQVSNLNADRAARVHERTLLASLRDDVRQDISETERRMRLIDQAAGFGLAVRAPLADKAPCTDDCWTIIVEAFQASQWFDLTNARPSYEELQRLGLPRDKALKDALGDYYLIVGGVAATNELPRYRELVRSLIPPKAQTRLWDDCYELDGRKETLSDACAPALSDEESRTVVEALRGHPDIVPSLTYRLSQSAALTKVLEAQIVKGQAVIALLDAELGSSR